MYHKDTICALATATGEAAISVIRVSGEQAFKICGKLLKNSEEVSTWNSHTIHYRNMIVNDEIIDDVLISKFNTPNSYTGEDSIEISCHGSYLIVHKIIHALLENGARTAEPGEFTKRAFMNGKLDLTQAEAVAQIISSRTDNSLKGARNQLNGRLSEKINYLRKELIDTSSLVELELDFAEEEIEFMPLDNIKSKVEEVVAEIEKLISSYSYGKIIRDGIHVAIVGKPNVGKSSLMNYILKEKRAIVSEIPGTTRDIIKEEVNIDGFLFKFVDTAGIREAFDEIEREGIERSREEIIKSDIALLIDSVDEEYDNALVDKITEIKPQETIIHVVNKIDIRDKEYDENVVKISVKTGEGINTLFEVIKSKVIDKNIYTEDNAIVTNLRHLNSLKKAKENLNKSIDTINSQLSGEFISIDIRNSVTSLSEIIGEVTSDDILNNIFSQFCIGK